MTAKQGRSVWFITGSQHLYGDETLRQVARDAEQVAGGLDGSGQLATQVVFKPVVTTPDAILQTCRAANADPNCVGVVAWMHTFSPARMWIAGLSELRKPLAHLHTQFERDIPWATIDMDYMNLHQSAHGGREFGHVCARLGVRRKVIVGHWKDERVIGQLATWTRVASAWHDWQGGKIARFGDNMRDVAVTEGDKVAAQQQFGYVVNGFGVGVLVEAIESVSDADVDQLIAAYQDQYEVVAELRPGGAQHTSLRQAARIEAGLRQFLTAGDFIAFTDTFEDLTGMPQLPGLAVQRVMADGYGFGAEGDWKTAALVRAMKVMAGATPGGTSFMEDYTYHFDPAGPLVLGAHMLEVCPSLAAAQPTLEIHPLGIGGKPDPVRVRFEAAPGPAVNVAMVDEGDQFRMLLNTVEITPLPAPTPRLPVGVAAWRPDPDLPTAAGAWILAGGPHHTCLSRALTAEHIEDFAETAGVDLLTIDADTRLADVKRELRLTRRAR